MAAKSQPCKAFAGPRAVAPRSTAPRPFLRLTCPASSQLRTRTDYRRTKRPQTYQRSSHQNRSRIASYGFVPPYPPLLGSGLRRLNIPETELNTGRPELNIPPSEINKSRRARSGTPVNQFQSKSIYYKQKKKTPDK